MATISSHVVYKNSGDDEDVIVSDIHLPQQGNSAAPVILFLHGLKGFKDWGQFPLVAEHLARSGFAVVRMNFSHNGTTPEHPAGFADPERFGKNTFSIELSDVIAVIDDLYITSGLQNKIDPRRIGLLGHSRGGGIALLVPRADPRVKAVATWAGVSDFEPRVNPPDLEDWKRKGVRYLLNSRTGQELPQYYSLREDFYANRAKLDIPTAVKTMEIPQLIIHGKADSVVPFAEAVSLKTWNPWADVLPVDGADHTFGGKHPWTEKQLPPHTFTALDETICFFREHL